MLVRSDEPVLDPSWSVSQIGMEDLVLAYMGQARDVGPGVTDQAGAKVLEEKR
jgi:hypothetical protein